MALPPSAGTNRGCRRINSILELVGDKWTVMIVMVLRDRPRRFNDLKRTVGGISQQMLTRTLKALERDGMVARAVHPTVPPQVEYSLTSLGRSLAEPLTVLGRWAEVYLEEIEGHRDRYERSTGSRLLGTS